RVPWLRDRRRGPASAGGSALLCLSNCIPRLGRGAARAARIFAGVGGAAEKAGRAVPSGKTCQTLVSGIGSGPNKSGNVSLALTRSPQRGPPPRPGGTV